MATIEELKLQRKLAYTHLLHSAEMYKRAKAVFESIFKRYQHDKDEYERIDRQLAFIDGRLTKLEPKAKGRKRAPELDVEELEDRLTPEMIDRIAKQLGIELPEVEDEEDEEVS